EQTTTAPTLPHPGTLTWDHDGLHPIAQTERIINHATQEEINSRFFAVITDLVGTPTDLIDETGTTAWHTRTTLWGTTAWHTDSTAYTPLRFPGQYYDPETALHYNHHRHYDPETARYTTPDPLGLAPAPNPHTYVHNPHTWTDPLGLAPCLNELGRDGKDGNHNLISGSMDGQRFAEQLRRESAESIFTPDGRMTPQAIAESVRIIDGNNLGNAHLRAHLTADGSSIADWGKYSTTTHQSPYGDFRVHFYYNPETGQVAYDYDYKVVMNRR
ncbi:RHS repeat-associated core domain-containing protein, partial [Streptomyces sp. 6N223]|uniref:RHS repeat-associated core domain-containing protein n=1 Tax=Streptomyces sp. 6N223 TaxID=3457412 RepID=UPI003FD2E172